MEAAKEKIDSDLQLGIIEKVDGVSRWCSPMSFVPKPNGKVRSVVDPVQLNKFVDRPTHPFPASKDIVSRIPTGSKCLFTRYLTAHTDTGKSRWRKSPDRTPVS
jgi:hypothetical protein